MDRLIESNVLYYILNFIFICCSDKGSGHGILEFSTDKAGQDVTPLNLEFDEPKQRSSTLNSITGESDYFFRSVSSFRGNDITIFLSFSFSCLFLISCLRNVVLCTTI